MDNLFISMVLTEVSFLDGFYFEWELYGLELDQKNNYLDSLKRLAN